MRAKVVTCITHEPLGMYPDARQGWCDVWIRFKAKPGRKKYYFGPTLMSRGELDADLYIDQQCQKKCREDDFSEEIACNEQILARMDAGERVVIMHAHGEGCPDIYINAPYIDRATAGEMLAAFMVSLGHANVVFRWRKNRDRLFVNPVSFDAEAMKAASASQ
jgi:hypothetical protein